MSGQNTPREWHASLKSQAGKSLLSSSGRHTPAKPAVQRSRAVSLARNTEPADQSLVVHSQVVQSPVVQSNDQSGGATALMFSARYSASENQQQDVVPQGNVVLLVVTSRRITSSGLETWTWQISAWEVRAIAPANHPTKQIPRKT